MFSISVKYPSEEEELEVMRRTTNPSNVQLETVLTAAEIREIQDLVPRIPAGDHVYRYALKLVRLTRPEERDAPTYVKECLSWGAGPRAAQYLILGAKARAILQGRSYATTEDVARVSEAVLVHRLVTNFNAEAEGITPLSIVRRLLDEVPREAAERI